MSAKTWCLFIDFDGVLLNTLNRFVADFKKLLLTLGASSEAMTEFWKTKFEAVPEWKSRAYYLMKNIELLEFYLGIKDLERARREIDALINRMPEYLYEDAMEFLSGFPEAKLFLLTAGGCDWQNLKIDKAGIRQFFTEVYVTDGATKAEGIQGLLDRGVIDSATGFFVDDRGKEIDGVLSAFPEITGILVHRPDSRYNDEPSRLHDFVVSDLREAQTIISIMS